MNWMKSREIRMASATFGEMAEDIKPIGGSLQRLGGVDSVFEVLCARAAPHRWPRQCWCRVWSKQAVELPQAWRDMYSYCNSFMGPQDSPAALAMTDGRWSAGLDHNGLRPMRYVETSGGMLIAGSEAGRCRWSGTRQWPRARLAPARSSRWIWQRANSSAC